MSISTKIFNIFIITFFMGGSLYLVAEKSWSLWTVFFGFIFTVCFILHTEPRRLSDEKR